MIKVELISSAGCKKCVQAREELKAAAQEVALDCLNWRDVNVLDELDYAVDLGVLTLPAIAVDGKLVFKSLPTAAEMRAEIAKRLQQEKV